MPNVEIIVTKNFPYATRRLKAGDSLTVSAKMAKVLVGIGKAEFPRVPGAVPPPPAATLQKAETLTPQQEVSPQPVGAISTSSVRTDPLDHDGNGRKGGSRKGTRRRRIAKKG